MNTPMWQYLTHGGRYPGCRPAWPELAMYAPLLASFACSLLCGDWSWFQRSGSLVALAVVLAELLNWLPRPHLVAPATVGTLTWGYGDLLGSCF